MNQNTVLATVNGKEITEQDVYAFLSELDPQIAAQFSSPDGVKRLVNELVNGEMLYLYAMENSYDQEEDFKSELERVKANILKKYAVNKILSEVSATEDEITQFYNDNSERFQKPEAVRASHILVDEFEKAKEIQDEIHQGLSFEEAAQKYSTCPSRQVGGDLGEFERGKMVPEFEEAAFNLKEGELSEPVKTQFGYHLIKLQYKNEARLRTIDEVREQIKQQVIRAKQEEKYFNTMEEFKNRYNVSINI
ncbi:MAG TPA: peptidylprolyl isomerase [Bacillota bacterium]|nr:peptidylprolyl isomerase [Clostridiales bacterium UBA9856]HOA42306.1 peptidylprolyl isomerase [Bacillota bacterium]HPZ59686.1 peptidylprolyl isomerase [Bacillota bacterium]HQC82212.1 peptidylprolyl isomerase [Bacillota bacterium]